VAQLHRTLVFEYHFVLAARQSYSYDEIVAYATAETFSYFQDKALIIQDCQSYLVAEAA
jgi:hypothetical protein